MDRMVYLAMTGAKQALQAQQVTSHNLANADTTGFRADFNTMLSRQVTGPTLPTRVYSDEVGGGSDMKQGSMVSTGNQLDVAVQGDGWLTVQAPDGTEAYTRRGDLRISSGGLLENGAGQLVMGNDGPVAVPPSSKIEIGKDGTISVVPLGQKDNAMVVVDRLRLVKPSTDNLRKGQDGLFRTVDGSTPPPDASVHVVSGTLESSNVNSVDALVQMIDHQRRYETYVKLMQTAKQNDETGQRLLRSSGG